MRFMEPKDYVPQIQEYCESNDLNFETLTQLSRGIQDNLIVFYCPMEGDEGKMGLLDETPMNIALMIRKTPYGVVFEQTEHTAKYLKK